VTWLLDLPPVEGRALAVSVDDVGLAAMVAAWAGAAEETRLSPDAAALPHPDGAFASAVIGWSLYKLANPTRVLLELKRVLAPGGTLVIVEPIRLATGTNQDHALAAMALLGRGDALRGLPTAPVFERLQVGSVIQGLGLVDIGFHPLLAVPEEAGWDLARCRAAGAPWVERLEDLAGEADMPPALREQALDLALVIRAEGVRTAPMMRDTGRVAP
jgi:SAM-dependent methyltransferase